MPAYDISHNPLTAEEVAATLVDDGSDPVALYAEAASRSTSNKLTAMAAAQATVPVDGSGNLLFTLSDWQKVSQWAARPYDSFDTFNLLPVEKTVMDDLISWGGGSPTSQANIMLRLIWAMRNMRLRNGLSNPNPIAEPNTINGGSWTAAGTPTFAYGTAPDGSNTATIMTCGATSNVYQTAVPMGQAIAGRAYTFRCWLRAPSKATIGLNIDAHSGSGDNTAQSIILSAEWFTYAVSKTFTLSGSSIDVGFDNRTGATGGDGIAGDVFIWNPYVTCES